MIPNRSSIRIFVALILGFMLSSALAQRTKARTQPIPEHYKKWVEEDAAYIISSDERKTFMRLHSDAERDQFIAVFWESRNPEPKSSINTFKEEHYRRLAYVRQNFGNPDYDDGWRTDMGRTYITLGSPQQRAKYHVGMNTREVELWFYQSPSPALPDYFNVVFYKRGYGDPFTYYSPREDGPQRLVTDDMHSDSQALKSIRAIMGSEMEHAAVTLFPGEPIDVDHPEPNMDSDLLLGAIRDLPDQKLEKDRIARQRALGVEKVTTSIFTGENKVDMETSVLRDSKGLPTVSYLIREKSVDPQILGTLPEQKTGYKLSLITRVRTADGKAVYQTQDELMGSVSEAGAKAAKQKLFAAEGRLPLASGSYLVESTLTNELTHVATRSEKKVVVPPIRTDGIGISDLTAYSSTPIHVLENQLPFSASKVRFTPRGSQEVQLLAGEQLPVMYQLWFPASDVEASKAGLSKRVVHVHYLIGSVANSQAALLERDEDIAVQNLDSGGSLLTGKVLDTSRLPQGSYRLVAKVTESGTARSAYATMTVKVLPEEATVSIWTAYGDEKQHPLWQDELLRGIAAEAQGDRGLAEACYKSALAINANAVEAQTRLNALSKKLAVVAPGTK